MKTQITAASVPPPAGPYSSGIISGNLLYCAGQGPFDSKGERVGETFEEQARFTLENIAAVATAAGTSLDHTVRVGVYLKNLDDFQALNAVMSEFFAEPWPVRTTIQANLRGFDIELDAIIEMP